MQDQCSFKIKVHKFSMLYIFIYFYSGLLVLKNTWNFNTIINFKFLRADKGRVLLKTTVVATLSLINIQKCTDLNVLIIS